MKKLLASLIVMVAVLALTSCGPKKEKLQFWHTMGDSLQKVVNEAIIEFEAEYPSVQIESVAVGGYNDVRNQILQNIPANTQPNLAYCYPDHVALYNKGNAVLTLDEFINGPDGYTAAEIADFVPGFYEEGRQFGDGKMYTLPFSKSTEVLYYDKTFFTNNKLAVPSTWAELKAVCEEIKKLKPSDIPLGFDSEANMFITLAEQRGAPYTSATGENYLFDNATNKDTVKFFKDMYDAGLLTTQEIYGNYTSGLFVNQPTEGKAATRCYMSIGSTGGASHQVPKNDAFEVGIATVPSWTAEKKASISQGPSLCMFDQGTEEMQRLTWLFVKKLLEPKFQSSFSRTSGYNPVRQSVYEMQDYKDFLAQADGTKAGITALSAKVSREQADTYYTSPAFRGSSVARDEVGDMFVAALKLPKGTGATFATELDKIFAKAIANCKA